MIFIEWKKKVLRRNKKIIKEKYFIYNFDCLGLLNISGTIYLFIFLKIKFFMEKLCSFNIFTLVHYDAP